MAVTGQQVYELALALIDEVTTGGTIDVSDLSIKTKAAKFLTILQTERLPSTVEPVFVEDLNANLLLSDRECIKVLPYGLAAHLLMQDDPATASFLNGRCEDMKRKKQAAIKPIVDVYDVTAGLR